MKDQDKSKEELLREVKQLRRQVSKIKNCLAEKETLLQEIQETLEEFRFQAEGCRLKFKEIHHRVRNNLNVINAFLSLKSLRIEDEICLQTLKEISARVYSIADIHDRLSLSEDLETVSCRKYFRALKKSLERAYVITESVRLDLEAEDLKLDTEKILSLGIMITEPVSNALKHAFPEGMSGEIRIDIRGSGDKAVLTVTDNGTGFPKGLDFRKTAGTIGLEIVRALVSQWQGTMDMESVRGTAFRITIPA